MKKKNQEEKIKRKDTLLANLADELNKGNKDGGKIAYFLDEYDDPSAISDWISTGSTLLDLAISNRKNGGLPVGRMVEFTGLEGSGKSLLSAHIIANTQKMGGKAIVIDTENAAAPEFWRSLGVDLSSENLIYIQTETVEKIFALIEQCIMRVRKDQPDLLLTIIVDSVAGATTNVELESDHGKDGYATGKAIIISKAMRKITTMLGRQKVLIVFTNQLRVNINARPGMDPYIVSGGKALAYHCSVRVRLSNAGKLKVSKDSPVIGNKCKAVVIKNRMGPPQRVANFNVLFDSGISDYSSWLKVLVDGGILKQAGAYYKYKSDSGEEIQFQTKEFISILTSRPEIKKELYDKMSDSVIMIYKDPNNHVAVDIEEDLDESEKKESEEEIVMDEE